MFPSEQYASGSSQSNDAAVPPDRLSVLIAYPKALTGKLIADALTQDRNFNVTGLASSPKAVMALATNMQVQVVLAGVTLAAPNDGLNIVRWIRSSKPSIRSVVLLGRPDPQLALDAFRSGAKGVFCISTDGYELLTKCIRCVYEGQIWATSRELNWVMDSVYDSFPATRPHSPDFKRKSADVLALSSREREILRLLADGRSNREIARILSLSENTIKDYLSSMFEKAGVSTRKDLMFHTLNASKRVLQFDPGKRTPLT